MALRRVLVSTFPITLIRQMDYGPWRNCDEHGYMNALDSLAICCGDGSITLCYRRDNSVLVHCRHGGV